MKSLATICRILHRPLWTTGFLLCLGLTVSASSCFAALDYGSELSSGDPKRIGAVAAALERDAAKVDPVTLIALGTRLFTIHRKEEALFWFYAGELRLRYLLALAPTEERKLGFSVVRVNYENILLYAQERPKQWAAAIQRVLQWDAKTPFDLADHNVTAPPSKAQQEAQMAKIREGFKALRAKASAMPEQDCKKLTADWRLDRKQRLKNGWPERPDAERAVSRLSKEVVPVFATEYAKEDERQREYRIPLNHLNPFGERPAELQRIVMFWPDLGGYTDKNWRAGVFGEDAITMDFIVGESGIAWSLQDSANLVAAAGAPLRQENGLQVFRDVESDECAPQEISMGQLASGEPVYLNCSAAPEELGLAERCEMQVFERAAGYWLRASIPRRLAPKWREIATRIPAKINAWQVDGPRKNR